MFPRAKHSVDTWEGLTKCQLLLCCEWWSRWRHWLGQEDEKQKIKSVIGQAKENSSTQTVTTWTIGDQKETWLLVWLFSLSAFDSLFYRPYGFLEDCSSHKKEHSVSPLHTGIEGEFFHKSL